MNHMDQELPPRPRADLVETELGADLAIYDPSREHVVMLNGPAGDVWRLLDGTTPVADIVRLLAQAYTTDGDAIEADVRAAVDLISEAGLLEP